MPLPHKKKTVLITGCSSGFGLVSAARLSAQDYTVYATMRTLAKKEDLLAEVERRNGEVRVIHLDVTDVPSIETAVSTIIRDCGTIDVVVNNAGYGIGGCFEDLTQEEIRAQMETNFFGVQNVTRAVLPLMRRQKSGTIINISSIAGLYALPCFSAYNASKWALEAFSESLYYELKGFGINVCLIEPGVYKTKIFFENRRCAANFDNPKSPYYTMSQFFKSKTAVRVTECTKDPEQIAILIEKLINAPRPPFRNFPDASGKAIVMLRRVLPFSAFSALVYGVWKRGMARLSS